MSVGTLDFFVSGKTGAAVVVAWYVEDGSSDSRWKSLTTHAMASGGRGGVS